MPTEPVQIGATLHGLRMLKPAQRFSKSNSHLPRWFHAVPAVHSQVFKQRPPAERPAPATYKYREDEQKPAVSANTVEDPKLRHGISTVAFFFFLFSLIFHMIVKRNEAGVQLLSRSLHKQVFKNCAFPSPPTAFTNIALEHLATHGLEPAQSSTLPSTEFILPPLQGSNLLEHFHRIGSSSSEPYFSLATEFASRELPPRPENWDLSPGWTKYIYEPDGSSYTEPVPYPMHDGQPETLLAFDIETMPKYHKFGIMACAASPNAWYSWISPWILDPTQSPEHLIPLGAPDLPRVVVGHNVSYDRARIREEYHINGTKNRFLDTMALHIAVKGISSNQRPAWMKHRKNKDIELERRSETLDVARHLRNDVESQLATEVDADQKARLLQLLQDLDESLPALEEALLSSTAHQDASEGSAEALDEDEIAEATQKRWEDSTSANSLLDVAKLHCNIDISKEIRNDFMTATPAEILENLSDYLGYCASDVDVTHQVYRKVLPDFLENCAHPVSFAGMLTMGSGFLPVNEKWEEYIERAEGIYQKMERQVKSSLAVLAQEAMERSTKEDMESVDDVWLSQLDWTPKTVGKTRGVGISEEEPSSASTKVTTSPIIKRFDS